MATLLQDPFPEEPHIKRHYPQTFHGTDKLGRPIYIERPGLIDMPRLLQVTTPERILEYIYSGTEMQIRTRLPACSLARGEVVDKSLNIIDLSGLGFRVVSHSTARRVLRDVVVMLQNHYPEMSGRVIIVNAPKVFSIAWSFVKPLLDEKTISKISIFGSDREAYANALLELVDADQLPALFGGACKCDGQDLEACMRSAKGPWTDPEILKVLSVEPLEFIMTPEGSKLVLQRRAALAANEAKASRVEVTATGIDLASCVETAGTHQATAELPTSPNGEVEAASRCKLANSLEHVEATEHEVMGAAQEGYAQESAGTLETTDQPASEAVPPDSSAMAHGIGSCGLALDGDPPSAAEDSPTVAEVARPAPAVEAGSTDAPETVETVLHDSSVTVPETAELPAHPAVEPETSLLAELKEADLEVALLWEECCEHEGLHTSTLTQWVEESNRLIREIGRGVIERAQGYYDSLSLWQQLVAAAAECQRDFDLLSSELEKARLNLGMAEAAFGAFLAGQHDLSDEEWERLAPLETENVFWLPESFSTDAKFQRSLRVSTLADRVAALQGQLEAKRSELDGKRSEAETAKRRFERAEQEHSTCNSSCSIRRAEPYFRQCQLQERVVQAQQGILHSLEQRLQKARQRSAMLRARVKEDWGPCKACRVMDETCLRHFEIPGAEPSNDERLS